MRPGETRAFALGVVECCTYFRSVPACAIWSVYPIQGARIGRRTGVFRVDAETSSGSVFRVSADVGRRQRSVSIDVHVFTPEDNPLVGMWREQAQLACGT